MARPNLRMAGVASQSQQLRWQANWVRAAAGRTHTRLCGSEAEILLGAMGNAFERLVMSPQAGQRLASLLDELAAQAAIQAAPAAVQATAGRVL